MSTLHLAQLKMKPDKAYLPLPFVLFPKEKCCWCIHNYLYINVWWKCY